MVNAPQSLTRSLGCLGVIFTLASIGQMVSYASYPGENVEGAVFSPDGKTLYGIGGDYTPNHWGGVLTAWNAETGRRLWRQELQDNLNNNDALSLSHDGKTLVLNRYDHLAFHDTATGRQARRLPFTHASYGSYSLLIPVPFTADDKEILVAMDGGILEVLDAQSGKRHGKLHFSRTDLLHGCALSPDGKRLVVYQGNQLILREWATNKTLAKQTVQETHYFNASNPLRFFSDGKRVLFDESVWNPAEKVLRPCNPDETRLTSPEGTRFVALEQRQGGRNRREPLGTITNLAGNTILLEGQTGW